VIVKDMDAYQYFLLQKLTKIEGVTGVHTSFVMKSTINSTALPVSGAF
jgi:Lrp/AsnC family leucine-responsive transcriptional regulator